jgi:uncharacterized membrane protein YfcA
MLVFVAGVEPRTAIASSLFVVGATSVIGAAMHARAGNVRWKVGAVFGSAAMGGAFAGGRVARFVPANTLLLLFAFLMIGTAIAMLRARREADAASAGLRPARALLLGATVGFVAGLVGAGGGFLVVPALTIFGGLAMREAIGTSLFVIALQSFAGFAGHVAHVHLDWSLVVSITAAAVVGSLAGAAVGRRVPVKSLRRGFAWLVLAIGIAMIALRLPIHRFVH